VNGYHRIIQLRDWHYVPHDLFALDMRQQLGKTVSDEVIEKLYQKHLREVELVQIQQEVTSGRQSVAPRG
jgi:hypothetical protein